MLALENVSVRYGDLAALSDVSIDVQVGRFVSIIGPNGAGKSTLFKAISGTVPLAGGRILFEGEDILRIPAAQRPRRFGIAHVPENRQMFKSLTVIENLQLGATPLGTRGDPARNIDYVVELFPALKTHLYRPAGTLSGGQQQMVAIGRGLVSSPRLLMLDEPSMGLSPAIVTMIFDRIATIHRESNLTVMLVEQRAAEALEVCDHGYVLSTGRIVAAGAGKDLIRDPQVSEAYLGG
jgi:branched-chain amino acid transport system ATP-binding protein